MIYCNDLQGYTLTNTTYVKVTRNLLQRMVRGTNKDQGGLCQDDHPLYGKEGVVRILLECILVLILY